MAIMMKTLFRVLASTALIAPLLLEPALAQAQLPTPAGNGQAPANPSPVSAPRRVALVIGDANYASGALNTPVNDAGLIASTLQAAGFDVVGLPNLTADATRTALRDFLTRAQAAGPQGTAFLYFAGHAVQYAGENYLVPTDATIASDTTIPIEAVRLSDYTRALAGLPLKARFVVVDGARANNFAKTGNGLASGLAIMQPDPGELIAFNAAPGTVAPKSTGTYGVYASTLAQTLREPGLPPENIFSTVRLGVNNITKGGQIPWDASTLKQPFLFFQPLPNAPPPLISPKVIAARRAKPIRDFTVNDAYQAAIERDTFDGYEQFLAAYPRSPLAGRVRAILASRREALTWERVYQADTPSAYWTYLRHYPHGIHAIDARRRLRYLEAALQPPPDFTPYVYDVPPPPPDELVYVDRPIVIFEQDDFPPPPPPDGFFLLPPRPDRFDEPPPRPPGIGFLPIPIPIPVPFARPMPQPQIHPNAGLTPTPVVQPGGAQPGGSPPGGGRPPLGGAPGVPPKPLTGAAPLPGAAPLTGAKPLPGTKPLAAPIAPTTLPGAKPLVKPALPTTPPATGNHLPAGGAGPLNAPLAPNGLPVKPLPPKPALPAATLPKPALPAATLPKPALPAATLPKPLPPKPLPPKPLPPKPLPPKPLPPKPVAPRLPAAPAPQIQRAPAVHAPVAPRVMAPRPAPPRPVAPRPMPPRPVAPRPMPQVIHAPPPPRPAPPAFVRPPAPVFHAPPPPPRPPAPVFHAPPPPHPAPACGHPGQPPCR